MKYAFTSSIITLKLKHVAHLKRLETPQILKSFYFLDFEYTVTQTYSEWKCVFPTW